MQNIYWDLLKKNREKSKDRRIETLFQSDKAHVFLFPHHLHAERDRQTARARGTGHTHTHARTSAAEAYFFVSVI